MKKIILFFLIINTSIVAQNCTADKISIKTIKDDVKYLADDKLEGRETGTKGEQLALEYIQKGFQEIGLKSTVHEFEFNSVVEVKFSSNQENLYVTKYSSSGEAKEIKIIDAKFGIHAPDLNYSDYSNLDVRGKAVLINISSPDGNTPSFKIYNA